MKKSGIWLKWLCVAVIVLSGVAGISGCGSSGGQQEDATPVESKPGTPGYPKGSDPSQKK